MKILSTENMTLKARYTLTYKYTDIGEIWPKKIKFENKYFIFYYY